jgi:hypothetical protein
MRLALLCTMTAALVPAVPGTAGHAAPPPACRGALNDPRGDAPSPDLDIVRTEIATGRTQLVVVLRVASLTAATGTDRLPASWTVAFTSRGVAYTAYLQRRSLQTDSYGFTAGGNPVPVQVRRDPTALVWVVPRKSLPRLVSFCEMAATTTLVAATADSAT